jgi:3-hydroxybutyryl-CoA dehydrogenase
MIKLKKVAVLGAGTMGAGIAQWFTQAGCSVQLYDVQAEQAQMAIEKINQSWKKLEEKGKFNSSDVKSFSEHISHVASLEAFDPQCDLVIEAIVENLKIKIDVFEKLNTHFAPHTIFASNTSSLPIDSMAKEMPKQRRVRFLGLHFFNPAPIMKLVEIIRGHWTEGSLALELQQWFAQQGKKPALCQDGPGFIVNRLARSFYVEPQRIIKTESLDKVKEVDTILKEVGGFRMGPFELMDLIGVDINLTVAKSVWQAFGYEPRFKPHAIQEKLVTSGRWGKKTKGGFYEY